MTHPPSSSDEGLLPPDAPAEMTAAPPTGKAPRLVYLCLQATREGQASHAHVHEIVHGLERRGWQVELIEPSYARSGRPPGPASRVLEFVRIQLRALLRMRDADLVYVRAHFAALPGSLGAALLGRPVVQELNGIYDDIFLAWPRFSRLRRVLVAAQRIQLRRASLVITVTEGLRTWVTDDAHPRRVAVVPNGANAELFTPGGPTAAGLPRQFVGFVGALAPWQGVATMLDAIHDPAWPAGVALAIAGDGALADEVRAAATHDDRVTYLGLIPYRSVPDFIRAASAMLSVQSAMPRSGIGGINPLKVFEALACGVPVIVTDHPGQADLVRAEGCGWVVPPDDPGAVARAVAECAAEPGRRMDLGRRGRAAVVRAHSWDARAEATHELLRQVLRESRA